MVEETKIEGIEITTNIGCINRCSFCPQEKLIFNYSDDKKIMDIDTFIKCVNKLDYDCRIHFSGFSEPFMNKDIYSMIDYAYHKGHKIIIYTTTIGMNMDKITPLKDMISDFKIDIPTKHMLFTDNKKKNWISNVNKLIENGFLINFNLTGIEDDIDVDLSLLPYMVYDINNIISRVGNNFDNDIYFGGNIKCSVNKHKQNILLPNGDLVLCCMDYSLENKIGNLLEQSIDDIYKSNKYRYILDSMNNGNDIICRRCEFAKNYLK